MGSAASTVHNIPVLRLKIEREPPLSPSSMETPGLAGASPGTQFAQLMADERGRIRFLKYLEKIHAAENLQFWLACESLKEGEATDKEYSQACNDIFDEYMSNDSHGEINISNEMQDKIGAKVFKYPVQRGLFDEVQQDVYNQMKKDTFGRFRLSDDYKLYLAEQKQPELKG